MFCCCCCRVSDFLHDFLFVSFVACALTCRMGAMLGEHEVDVERDTHATVEVVSHVPRPLRARLETQK